MPASIAQLYRDNRREYPDVPAHVALSWARTHAAADELAARIEWDEDHAIGAEGTPFSIGRVGGAEIRLYLDDEPFEWGDAEPTESDREDLKVIGVGVYIGGEDDPVPVPACDSRGRRFMSGAELWGIGFTHDDAQREALRVVVESGYLEAAARELRERAEWSARGVVTV